MSKLIAALYLTKAYHENEIDEQFLEEDFEYICDLIEDHELILVEEYLILEKFLIEDGEGIAPGAPANSDGSFPDRGGIAKTDLPVGNKRKKPLKRQKPVQIGE